MPTIRNKLLKLMQDINSFGISFPMLYIKLDFIEKMELEKDSIPIFKESLDKIDNLADKALKHIEDYGSLIDLKNAYSEAYIFSKLRSLLVIDKIPEQDIKAPDFKVMFRNENIFIELKSLNMLNGYLKHKVIMNEALDAKILAGQQIRNGSKVGFSEHVIEPYYTSKKGYDPRSTRVLIESLIDKINQNIKTDQYSLGDTILLIDLSDQLPLLSKPTDAIQKNYYDNESKVYISGELWHIAFGRLQDKIFKPAEFDGADSSDGSLSKEGILVTHPYIKGLIFHVSEAFYSLVNLSPDNLNTLELIKYISKNYSCNTQN